MGKSLVIVESPAKARTINKYLGRDYVVKSSVGHIRDLPVSGSGRQVDAKARAQAAAKTRALAKTLTPKQRAARKKKKTHEAMIARMGINPEKDWKAHYEILPGKEKVVKELKKLAKDADMIYLATDLDREGEAIAWHLREVIGGGEARFKRVVFNEITKSAIQEAFEDPGKLDLSRVNAQQARRFLDRVVGYMLSPLLWSKVARGLSAGRVQSVAVRLLVEREREIHAFIPEEFWELYADLQSASKDSSSFPGCKRSGCGVSSGQPGRHGSGRGAVGERCFRGYGSKRQAHDQSPVGALYHFDFAAGGEHSARIQRQEDHDAGSALVRGGSHHVHANRLDEPLPGGRRVMSGSYPGPLRSRTMFPKTRSAIPARRGPRRRTRPFGPRMCMVEPEQLTDLERDQVRLYEIIWRQFVACQMPPARYKSTNLTIETEGFELRTRGRILVFDGYTAVQPPATRSDAGPLPDIQVGEVLKRIKLDPIQHFTKPPPRFSEASLVKELESRGNRSSVDLRLDHFHDPGSRLRPSRKPTFLRREDRGYRDRTSGGEL